MTEQLCSSSKISHFLSAVVLLLSSVVGAGWGSDGNRIEIATICVLPLGDSLTQGVGSHGSYREPLQELMKAHFAANLSSEGSRRYALEYVGSNERTCTPKHPNDPYAGDEFVERHEGHCGFNANNVYAVFMKEAVEYSCAPHIVLLMAGHNDAFQAARVCKLRERDATPSGRHKACANEMMWKQFHKSMTLMIDAALLRFRKTTHVLVGMNPTTHFPVLDGILHGVLHDLEKVFSKEPRVRFVEFYGWSEADTFDSTHPNKAGNMRMAQAWFQALRDLGPLVIPPPQTLSLSQLHGVDIPPKRNAKLDDPGENGVDEAGAEMRAGGDAIAFSPNEAGGVRRTPTVLFGVALIGVLAWWVRNRRSASYRRIPFTLV
jgi:lysophospholipase L1-like esterase